MKKLFLLFRIGADRYALDACEVVEVLPLLRLKQIPEAPHWVAGVFAHRGMLVPVLDLSALTFAQPAAARTSTRIVLVHYRAGDDGQGHPLGLILEQVTDTLRCNPGDFRDYGLDNQGAPYLGPVFEGARGLVQWIRVQQLLPAAVRAILFPPATLAEQRGEVGL
ncbi:purine-binding chemotaxis protein CheW [Pseudomonas cavernicola]|uniref:Purine-binding chemotaxis protein CheW n=1 Tax=Pseudomonas cavernicola TaxID=2320866 RepID=A0A418XCG2_9PSED|nr:chemotaxis protein CheW [Pseudomonas cavernicola]RJG10215.1 purine-binding chemotaxis protein CheW [Pseudomonas cavernicola]